MFSSGLPGRVPHHSADHQRRNSCISEPLSTGPSEVMCGGVFDRSAGSFVGLLDNDPSLSANSGDHLANPVSIRALMADPTAAEASAFGSPAWEGTGVGDRPSKKGTRTSRRTVGQRR